jgi:hypothetical protein
MNPLETYLKELTEIRASGADPGKGLKIYVFPHNPFLNFRDN